jgi:diguanylate cyclase (GGDEF)-like protein
LYPTKLGMVVGIMLVAGGLYWTASVGLLTVSALTAYPKVMWIGATVLSMSVVGAILWIAWSSSSDSNRRVLSESSNVRILSTYDSVTGLPTNRLFTSLLNQALPRAHKNGRLVAVLMVELDHFTLTSELQGHVNRNMIYRVQAARMKSALRTTDCVARFAERTFVVLLDQVMAQDDVIAVAKKMQATVSLPFTLDGHEVFLTSRIGISLATQDGGEGVRLIEAATQAVATARAEGYAMYGLHGAVVTPQVDSTATIAA